MLLLFVLFFPVFAAVLTLLMPQKRVVLAFPDAPPLLQPRISSARSVALGCALVELAAAVMLAVGFDSPASIHYDTNVAWLADAGVRFHIGVDGLSLLMVLLTAFLLPIIVLVAWGHELRNERAFYALMLLMQTGLTGVFVSLDGFLFYFFWELALIPIYFLAGIWSDSDERVAITFKFFLYTIVGSLFMLAAFVVLYVATPGAHSSDIQALYAAGRALPPAAQSLVFWGIFLAFAVKMPVVPFHTWQPATYTAAPTPATMLLSGIMLKMGLYGVLRWLLPMVPAGAQQWGAWAIGLSVLGVVYGAIIAIRQSDVKTLFAYSSLSHVGLIAAGLFVGVFTQSPIGAVGGVVQMLSHGVCVVGLFYGADWMMRRTGTRTISELGGLARTAPVFATLFLVLVMGSVALPLTSGFVGEFLLLQSIFAYHPVYGAVAGLTIIFGAVYLLRMYQLTMLGEANAATEGVGDVSGRDLAVLVPLIVLVFWIGLYPKPFLDLAQPAVQALIAQAGQVGAPMVGVR
ncbi:MAG: NADH-quinone oxidoreductase subunit M [Hymenobacteraceae bacterium]|nr:NADH-quinone oxidoreductase subunit M [Hymenobacteraceae bacterium]